MGHWCCVIGCKSNSNGRKPVRGIRFFRFPRWKRAFGQQVEEITKRRRAAWVAAVRRKDITFDKMTPYVRVCSRHFHKGQPAYEMMETDPDWTPSLHMGHTDIKPTDTARSARRSHWEQQRNAMPQAPKASIHQAAKTVEQPNRDAAQEAAKVGRRNRNRRYCSVVGCSSNSFKQPYLHFHSFPGNVEVGQKWVEVIKQDAGPRTQFLVRKGSRHVCSKHFTTDDYIHWQNVSHLKWDAVPSLFSWKDIIEKSVYNNCHRREFVRMSVLEWERQRKEVAAKAVKLDHDYAMPPPAAKPQFPMKMSLLQPRVILIRLKEKPEHQKDIRQSDPDLQLKIKKEETLDSSNPLGDVSTGLKEEPTDPQNTCPPRDMKSPTGLKEEPSDQQDLCTSGEDFELRIKKEETVDFSDPPRDISTGLKEEPSDQQDLFNSDQDFVLEIKKEETVDFPDPPKDISTGLEESSSDPPTDFLHIIKKEEAEDISAPPEDISTGLEEEPTDHQDIVLGVERKTEDGEGTAAKTQAMRSHTGNICTSQQATHLLPACCIICKHEKYRYQSCTRKRLKERLVKCETVAAGKLLLAAEERKDESLLLYIRDRDLVACQAKYHFTCFRGYTRYQYHRKHETTESNLFENGYKYFCEDVIEKRLLKNREVLRLSRLNMIFKDVVREREGINISTYQAHSLKVRLQKTYPFLGFTKVAATYFVYVDDQTAEEVVHEVSASSLSPSFSSEAEGNEVHTAGSSHTQHANGVVTKASSQLLHHAAFALGDIIRNTSKTSPELPWPPTVKDRTLESALNAVPHQLFNFVAWASGISKQPSDNKHVEVTLEHSRKIVSVCQDIITLSTKGL